jgi:hypothetical protein
MFKNLGLFLDHVTFFLQNVGSLKACGKDDAGQNPGIRQVRLFSGTLTKRCSILLTFR